MVPWDFNMAFITWLMLGRAGRTWELLTGATSQGIVVQQREGRLHIKTGCQDNTIEWWLGRSRGLSRMMGWSEQSIWNSTASFHRRFCAKCLTCTIPVSQQLWVLPLYGWGNRGTISKRRRILAVGHSYPQPLNPCFAEVTAGTLACRRGPHTSGKVISEGAVMACLIWKKKKKEFPLTDTGSGIWRALLEM